MTTECTKLRDFVDTVYAWRDGVFKAHRQWEDAVVAILVENALDSRRDAKVLRERSVRVSVSKTSSNASRLT